MLNTHNSFQAEIQLKNRIHTCMFAWTVQTGLTDVRQQVLRSLNRSNNSYTENFTVIQPEIYQKFQ